MVGSIVTMQLLGPNYGLTLEFSFRWLEGGSLGSVVVSQVINCLGGRTFRFLMIASFTVQKRCLCGIACQPHSCPISLGSFYRPQC